jgi:hypothetical protein
MVSRRTPRGRPRERATARFQGFVVRGTGHAIPANVHAVHVDHSGSLLSDRFRKPRPASKQLAREALISVSRHQRLRPRPQARGAARAKSPGHLDSQACALTLAQSHALHGCFTWKEKDLRPDAFLAGARVTLRTVREDGSSLARRAKHCANHRERTWLDDERSTALALNWLQGLDAAWSGAKRAESDCVLVA